MMNKFQTRIYCILMSSICFLACRAHKIEDHLFDKGSLRLTFSNNHNFEYFYASSGNLKSENAAMKYSDGIYKKISVDHYILFPIRFNPDSIRTEVKLSDSNSNNPVHLTFNTGIVSDVKDEFKTIVHFGTDSVVVSGFSVDMLLKKEVTELSVEIFVPNYYLKAIPPAKYKKLSTGAIKIKGAKNIQIYAPITWYYLYYNNSDSISIIEKSKYYLVNGEKVRKARIIN